MDAVSPLRVKTSAASIQVVVSHKLIDFLHQVDSAFCLYIRLQQAGPLSAFTSGMSDHMPTCVLDAKRAERHKHGSQAQLRIKGG